jgi:acylphosphatase
LAEIRAEAKIALVAARQSTTQAGIRRTVHFTGRVQGVGFRYTTRNIALRHNVHGYVRNLPDGRVELIMEGPQEETEHVVEELGRKMNGFIRKVESSVAPPTGEFEHFVIKH